ncbi:hypothetical protein BHM03_00022295 [Ensete ventricosum]|nr:hypothetical protein BHM03_00022295 [Ensete ventricosum]
MPHWFVEKFVDRLSRAYREFTGRMPGVRREFTERNRELAGGLPEGYREFTGTSLRDQLTVSTWCKQWFGLLVAIVIMLEKMTADDEGGGYCGHGCCGVGEAEGGWMKLWAIVAIGGEEEMRRVRHGATVAAIDDSGCDWKQRRKKMAADDNGREQLLQRRGGSGCVVATRATSGGCVWSRKDSDGRREEATDALTFGAAAATGEMGI